MAESKRFCIGVDNYGLSPLRLSPMEVLRWAHENGAEGVHFSGLTPEQRQGVDTAYLKDLAQYAEANNLYLEWGGGQHIPFNMETWERRDIFENNRLAAEEAALLGTRIIRSCSGGLMRWNPENPSTDTLIQEMAASLRSQRQMLRDHNIVLAVETHFEFTTHELLNVFERCEAEPGDYLGVCLDPMNVLTMLEDPVMATERVLPWVVSTHVKDGAIILGREGLTTFTAEIGKGVVDFESIARRLAALPLEVNLSVEDHGGSFSLPIFDPRFLSAFPDLNLGEFVSLIKLCTRTEERMREEKLAVTDRAAWPAVCEARMKRDIQNLRKLLGQR